MRILLLAGIALLLLGLGDARAETRLRFAHVYETSEPYHTNAVWAAEEIKRRTEGRHAIDVFPASQLGNEPQINEGVGLGTISMIYTGVSFAGAIYKPIAISNGPYMFRDFAHWQAYRDSSLFAELAAGYEKATGHKILALTYYGERHVTANKPILVPADMKGLKLRVPQAPLFLLFARAFDANATPIAFAEVYLALQTGTVDAQENPLPTIFAKRFYEVQDYINLTGHITESLLTIVGASVWSKVSEADRQIFAEVLKQAAERSTEEIRTAELAAPAKLERLGKQVTRPDRTAFRDKARPFLTGADVGWTKEQFDRLQALGTTN